MRRSLVAEQRAGRDSDAWREADDSGRVMLVITGAGLNVIGVDDDRSGGRRTEAKTRRKTPNSRGARAVGGRRPKVEAAPVGAPPGTKQALLVDLLRRKNGVTIAEIAKATGWQAHSVRGAISGTLKRKLGLTVQSEVVEGRGRLYRIAERG